MDKHPDTRYAIVRENPSGERFAIRYLDNGHGTITGVCGPLYWQTGDEATPGADYDYDTDPTVLAEWNAVGTDDGPAWGYALSHDLAAE